MTHRRWFNGLRSRAAIGVAVFGLVAGMTLATAGTGATAAGAASKYTIALVPGFTVDPFYITMHYGAIQEAKKLGVNLKWVGATTFSPESETPVLNGVLASKPDALLVTPTDSVAMFNPIDQFVKAGIPVIAVDTTLKNTSILTSAISSDNYQGGEAAADTIARLSHDKGQVAIINTFKGVSTSDLRVSGFLFEMKKYTNMQMVALDYDQDNATTAESLARALILGHPDLVGIFATNGYSAEGVGKGVDVAGMKGKVFVAGYDGEPAQVALLKTGVINILVIQNPAEEGALAVQYAYDYLTGHKSLIKKSVLLSNVVATTLNANNPGISKYYYRASA
jgi:ribose transport system substrate-binding protein